MNNIFTVIFTIYLIACVSLSTTIFTFLIIVAINNKALAYFDGEFFQYNPAKDKKALIIPDRRLVELDMDCSGNSGGKYDIALYSHTANRVTVFNVVTNDEYRSIYGMDHPCHKE